MIDEQSIDADAKKYAQASESRIAYYAGGCAVLKELKLFHRLAENRGDQLSCIALIAEAIGKEPETEFNEHRIRVMELRVEETEILAQLYTD